MCTRIFNSLNPSFPMTGRNFDWHNQLTTYLYRLPSGGSVRFGIDKSPNNEAIHSWRAKYSSICTYLGDDNLGLAAIDGINEKGLIVNGLEDLFAYFKNLTDIVKSDNAIPQNIIDMIEADKTTYCKQAAVPDGAVLMSSLRWVQFTLDSFKSVREAANYYRKNPDRLFVFSEFVPDGEKDDDKKTLTKLHLAISDSSGNSAIIELRGNGFSVNESPSNNVVTVTPRYEVQQLLLQRWKKKWDTQNEKRKFNLHSVPGGTATHQRFARASYFYQFSQPSESNQGVLGQTRSLMATCATPLNCHFESEVKSEGDTIPSATTLWCSIGEHVHLQYHLVNSSTLAHHWLDFKNMYPEPQRTKLVENTNNKTEFYSANLYGSLANELTSCPAPFEKY